MLQTHLDTRPRQPTRRSLIVTLLGACIGVGAGSGCEEYGPRVYTAAPYRAELGCLGPYVPIGVVQARELGSQCEPVCLSDEDTLYVSAVCAPYPAEATIEASDASACVAALEALDAMDYCENRASDAAAP
jgi:hypothetical protein